MFKPQYVDRIRSGVKWTTIRPVPKVMPHPKDIESWRFWAARPYHSKTVEIKRVMLLNIQPIWFNGVSIILGDEKRENCLETAESMQAIAVGDGFNDLKQMAGAFEEMHGFPFRGIYIQTERPVPGICKRCGQPFVPELLDALKQWQTCCETCSFRNMCDGLNLPTPPTMLDAFTKHPTLTPEEFDRRIKTDRPRIDDE